MNTRTLQIGALCDPISKQLAGLISEQDAKALDRHNDANQPLLRARLRARIRNRPRPQKAHGDVPEGRERTPQGFFG